MMTDFEASIEAIYAGRPFSRLPRESLHNFVSSMVRLLS